MQFKLTTLLTLPLLASTALAVTLNDIQSLNKDDFVLGCYNAYNTELKSCTKEQLTSHKCSSDCTKELETVAPNIMLACRQAFAGPDTLLRKIIDGGLVVTLCGSGNGGSEGGDKTSSTVKSGASTTSGSGVKTSGTPTGTAVAETESVSETGTATSSGATPTGTSGGNETSGEDDEGAAGSVAVSGFGVVVAAIAVGFAAVF